MHKGFITYCPNCHYHTEFFELSPLSAVKQVDADWEEIRGEHRHCAVNCPICYEILEDWYGSGEPMTNGPYKGRIVSTHFLEVINETV